MHMLFTPIVLGFDVWGFLGSAAATILGEILSLLDGLLWGIVNMMWAYVFNFLRPENAFPTVPYTNIGPPQMTPISDSALNLTISNFVLIAANWAMYFLSFMVIPLLGILIVIYGMVYMFDVLRGKGESIFETFPKIIFGLILSFLTLMVVSMYMDIGRSIYDVIFYGVNYNGVYLKGIVELKDSPIPGLTGQILNGGLFTGPSAVEWFVFLFVLISLLITFLVTIVTRLIWIIVSIMVLPFASILYPFRYVEEYGKKLWINFLEKGFDIFLIGLPLLLLPWVADKNNDPGTAVLILIAIFSVAMALPHLVSKVGTPGYPNPSHVVSQASTIGLQTGMQAGMMAAGIAMMAGGAWGGGLLHGARIPGLAGGGSAGGMAGVQAVAKGPIGAGLPAGQKLGGGGVLGLGQRIGHGAINLVRHGKNAMVNHINHAGSLGKKGSFTEAFAHVGGAPFSFAGGVTGYGIGKGIGALRTKWIARSIMKHPEKLKNVKENPILMGNKLNNEYVYAGYLEKLGDKLSKIDKIGVQSADYQNIAKTFIDESGTNNKDMFSLYTYGHLKNIADTEGDTYKVGDTSIHLTQGMKAAARKLMEEFKVKKHG